jgi:hypothetical protein
MSRTHVHSDTAIETPSARRVDMKPEVVVIQGGHVAAGEASARCSAELRAAFRPLRQVI